MVILKYLENLKTSPKEKYWTYELLPEMPHWDEEEKEFVCNGKSKIISAKKAQSIIEENGLECVCDNKYGKIYK